MSFECRSVSAEVGKSGAARIVLDDVSFHVAKGEFVSIMGRSGAGKTTLLRVLAGLQQPASGSIVQFEGRNVDGPPDGVGLVFQDYTSALLPWRTVAANVALPLEATVTNPERRARVEATLEMVGLADRADDRPPQLSGGMQQRVQLARALASRPSALLMDEPFGALDALTKSDLEDELLALAATTATTVVFVTHDIDEAVYLSDRVLVVAGEPAHVAADIAVDCPRPRTQIRTRESPEFLAVRSRVHEVIFGTR